MSLTYQELRVQAEAVNSAQAEFVTAKIERDSAKMAMEDVELSLRFDGLSSGQIDGKNVEQRAAQEANLRRTDPRWQIEADRYRRAQEAVQLAEMKVVQETLRLKVMALGWNAQIAEQTGSSAKLLSEVSLAGV